MRHLDLLCTRITFLAGNYANEYGVNIGTPLGDPTAEWNTGL